MLLGGKGANLCAMTQIGLDVPPGFVITTAACLAYLDHQRLPDGLMDDVRRHIAILERKSGKGFGSATDPLLVSVRSGSAMSMPGMMDTILNLGLNAADAAGARRADRQSAVHLGRLPPLHPALRQDRDGRSRRGIRRGDGVGQAQARRRARRRPRCRCAAGARAGVPRRLPGADGSAAADRSLRAARALHPRGIPVVERQARGRLPAAVQDHAGDGQRHGGQRLHDGLRQHGRRLCDRRGLHAQSGYRREPHLRRISRERAGRGRRRRHPHAEADRGDGAGDAGRSTGNSSSCGRSSRPTTRRYRTSSSRSSAAGSTACRRATAR